MRPSLTLQCYLLSLLLFVQKQWVIHGPCYFLYQCLRTYLFLLFSPSSTFSQSIQNGVEYKLLDKASYQLLCHLHYHLFFKIRIKCHHPSYYETVNIDFLFSLYLICNAVLELPSQKLRVQSRHLQRGQRLNIFIFFLLSAKYNIYTVDVQCIYLTYLNSENLQTDTIIEPTFTKICSLGCSLSLRHNHNLSLQEIHFIALSSAKPWFWFKL